MKYWKLGCRWGSKKDGFPLFIDLLEEHNFVISWVDKDFEKDNVILLTDGFTPLAVAVTKSERKPVENIKHLQHLFTEKKIEFDEKLFYYEADIYPMSAPNFKFEYQVGIGKIHNKTITASIDEFLQQILHKKNMKNIITVLEHKKQIILQGPPGTGKTRLAKQIAQELCNQNRSYNEIEFMSNGYIEKALNGINKVQSSKGRTMYKISGLKADRCTVSLESNTSYEIPYSGIKDAYKNKLWEGGQRNGLDPYNAAIAKYLFGNWNIKEINKDNSTDYTIIQFHPSYTYEDFVRGISVENNKEGKIVYKTTNRILAEYASKALKNYNDFHKDKSTYSKEILLDKYFSLFVDKINDKIENSNGFYKLTDSVGMFILDEDAFRYKSKAEGWNLNGNRMLFADIKQSFLDGNIDRQHLKHNMNLSGLARQHASYFVRVLNLFQQFLKDEKLTFENNEVQKEPLKNYVLIIDEINRANLSSVLGELIYALEYRGEPVDSIYKFEDSRKIILPPNLFIIGTMNTADRSVGQIDYAIRRRFAFVDILPKILSETDLNSDKKEKESRLFFKKDVFLKVQELFKNKEDKNSEHLSEEFEAKDVQLGHSYFIYTEDNFKFNLDYEIKPILKEYVTDGILKTSALNLIEQL